MREEIRRRGEKVGEYSCKQLNDLAEDYLLEHVDEVLDQAHSLNNAIVGGTEPLGRGSLIPL
jgi:hypothetical protein